jgi:hypothetical protein
MMFGSKRRNRQVPSQCLQPWFRKSAAKSHSFILYPVRVVELFGDLHRKLEGSNKANVVSPLPSFRQ